MAEKATLKDPYYKIIAVGGGNSFVGVGPTKPSFQNIHLDAAVHIWEIKPLPDDDDFGIYWLSLKDSYPYTHVEQDKSVVATFETELNFQWRIQFWREFGAYTIEMDTFLSPPFVWTVSSDKRITIEFLLTVPKPTQLFKIETVV